MHISKDLKKRLFIFKLRRYIIKLATFGLMLIAYYVVYSGVRVTFFNIPITILGVTIQHELSLALWVFGAVAAVVLLVVMVDKVRPPRQKMLWNII